MKIVSGGQTGVDRAALDIAKTLGFEIGGWCPRGGWAEDRTQPPGLLTDYPELKETPNAEPEQRTEWNVRDSDATVIVVEGEGVAVSAGTQLAIERAKQFGKMWIVLDAGNTESVERLKTWLAETRPRILSVGGPRESEAPGIYEKARQFLREGLSGAR